MSRAARDNLLVLSPEISRAVPPQEPEWFRCWVFGTGGFALATSTRLGMENLATPAVSLGPELVPPEGLEQTIERGTDHLLSLQYEAGYWLGELQADTTLESDYIYYLHVLGKADPAR